MAKKKATKVKPSYKKVKSNNPSIDKEGYELHSSDKSFIQHDFKKDKTFYGDFVETKTIPKKGKRKEFTIHEFTNDIGETVSLPDHFQIRNAIEKHGKVSYKIQWKGKKRLEDGNVLTEYLIGTK